MKTNHSIQIYTANDKETGVVQLQHMDLVTGEAKATKVFSMGYTGSDVSTTLDLIEFAINQIKNPVDFILIHHSCGNLHATRSAAKQGRGKFAGQYDRIVSKIRSLGIRTHIVQSPIDKKSNPAWINREAAQKIEKVSLQSVEL